MARAAGTKRKTVSESALGPLLRQWRERRRMSQLTLAVEAEVSSRHHHAVGNFENGFQLIESLWFFKFGNHRDILLMRRDNIFDLTDVSRRAHKRERDGINPVLQAEFQVFAVFVGQCRN